MKCPSLELISPEISPAQLQRGSNLLISCEGNAQYSLNQTEASIQLRQRESQWFINEVISVVSDECQAYALSQRINES